MPYIAQPFTVRVVYVVPKDAEPWEEAERRATEYLEDIQWFYAGEMKRLGYRPKTIEIAKDKDGKLVFHKINSSRIKEDFRKNPANNCKEASDKNELRSTNDIVVYFHESYTITNGIISYRGDDAQGQKREIGGEAFLSCLHLKVARREWIANNNGYDGAVFDWISPEPMKRDTLSWGGRGLTLGDISGSAYGIITHELTHCFGLSNYNGRGDKNRKGFLMGNGCRGMRGYFRSDLTDDFCSLSEQTAAVLNKSPFFAVRVLKPKSMIFSA